ncbi:serine/threonine-protein kinase [Sorangium cellulosum]|nr:serine/threonine-protein kinase [Sorangium cellulosum]
MTSTAPTHDEAEGLVRQGQVIAGKYRVDRVIGVGGMGVVVAATHLQLEEQVAIKLLLPAAAHSRTLAERFVREARAAVKVKSEHVARVTDVGTLESGTPYMVMEYLSGSDLADALRAGGPIPPQIAVEYVLQACEALAEAHAAGIVHRDLKPANLFLTRRADGSPCVKVLDFGISKVATGGADPRITDTTAVMGSPLYMSPEQLKSARDVDARTDIWSLGVILFELLAGAPPFDGATMPQLCVAIMQGIPRPLASFRPDVPPALEAVILRCLEKMPERRFRDVGALAEALAPFASGRARVSIDRISGISRSSAPSRPDAAARSGAISPTMASTSAPWTGTVVRRKRPVGLVALAGIGLSLAVALGIFGFLSARAGRDGAPAEPSASAASFFGRTRGSRPAPRRCRTRPRRRRRPAPRRPRRSRRPSRPAASRRPRRRSRPHRARPRPPPRRRPAASPRRRARRAPPLDPRAPRPRRSPGPPGRPPLLPPRRPPRRRAATCSTIASEDTTMTSLPMQHLGRLLALAMFLAALVGGGRDARADTAAAQALFDAARQLMAQGKHAEACPKLEESQRLDPGIGTQFNLAACYEQVGRTASAWSTFLDVAGAAKAAGQPEREKVARQRATALEPKLIRLTITAPADAPADLQVKRDGALVGRAQWGTPVPVDPGKHTVEASAAGRSPFVKTVELNKAGASETVTVPQLAGAPARAAAPPVSGPAAPPPARAAAPPASGAALAPVAGRPAFPPPQPLTRRRSKGMMVTGIVLTSIGAVALLGGGLALAADSATDPEYTGDPTDPFEEELGYEEDASAAEAGVALILGGVVFAGVGIPLAIVGGRKVPVQPEKKAASAPPPELVLGPRYAGLRWSM